MRLCYILYRTTVAQIQKVEFSYTYTVACNHHGYYILMILTWHRIRQIINKYLSEINWRFKMPWRIYTVIICVMLHFDIPPGRVIADVYDEYNDTYHVYIYIYIARVVLYYLMSQNFLQFSCTLIYSKH